MSCYCICLLYNSEIILKVTEHLILTSLIKAVHTHISLFTEEQPCEGLYVMLLHIHVIDI